MNQSAPLDVGSGAPGRIAAVHAQTRPGLLVAVAFTVVALVLAVVGLGTGWWLPLHVFVVGGLLGAIAATTQMLAVTWSTAPAPRPVVAAVQRWALAAGAAALVIGRETERTWLFVAGGITVVVAMLGLAVILIQVRQRAVTDRFAPAIESYVAAVVIGSIGMSIGILLGTGHVGTRIAEFRATHLILNVFGLVGLIIAGTLPYFAATQVRSKMSPRATPTALRAMLFGLVTATAVAATGAFLDRPGVSAVGLFAYVVGLLSIAAMLPVYSRKRLKWAGPRLLQLMAGILWWAAMAAGLAVVGRHGTDDSRVLQALVVGGFAQIFVASLAYLGPVLRGGGHQRLTAGFALTRSWVSLVAGNVAPVAALVGSRPLLAVALGVWMIDIVARSAVLLAGIRGAAQG
ncbi:MAG TPA: hypothetical protein PK020_00190 [Ilumatobacteraceae bacterium]|nr:hypothetical protein [Ilumatobacteraceae bacterium]HRB03790.1 hypothetical protein [Ilumatobacteraceae bacterium]